MWVAVQFHDGVTIQMMQRSRRNLAPNPQPKQPLTQLRHHLQMHGKRYLQHTDAPARLLGQTHLNPLLVLVLMRLYLRSNHAAA